MTPLTGLRRIHPGLLAYRMSMTFQTPAHRERFNVANDIHLGDGAVTLGTVHTSLDMGGVVEIREIRHPLDSLPR
jgi:hypothetical protein